MSICDPHGPPNFPTDWWKEVGLQDVADCTARVKGFIDEAGAEDASEFLKAFPLLVLCGGDWAWLAERIETATNCICKEAKSQKAVARLKKWRERLTAIRAGLSRLPDSYRTDVSEVYDIVGRGITDCRQAILRIKAPKSNSIFSRKA